MEEKMYLNFRKIIFTENKKGSFLSGDNLADIPDVLIQMKEEKTPSDANLKEKPNAIPKNANLKKKLNVNIRPKNVEDANVNSLFIN